MGFFARFQILVGTTVSIGVVAIVVQNVFPIVTDLSDPNDTFSGLQTQITDLGPLVLALMLLAILAWFIISTVQEERTVEEVRRRRRR
jgi:hypothetical protein